MSPADARSLDVVVWGATGYTGGLLTDALVAGAPAGLRWGIGGRDRDRLESLRSRVGLDVEIVVADATDPSSLRALARRTRVVASTVGPYAVHGTALVAACLAEGTDYVDITGETLWMRRSIDAFHAAAFDRGTRIVHACGFDSVPSDLGVLGLQRAARATHDRACDAIEHLFGPMAGGVSGGTIASLLGLVAEAGADASAQRALADPDLLAPGSPPSPAVRSPWWPAREPALARWTAPFPMAAVNERVVRRTAALLEMGSDLRYRERWDVGGWGAAAAVGLVTAGAVGVMANGPLRRWIARSWLPAAGSGPSASVRARGFFRTTLVGRVPGADRPVVGRWSCDLDPGYGATAVMLREAALALLDAPGERGGVLTPAVAFGTPFLGRLAAAGVRFEVDGAQGAAAASDPTSVPG